VAEKIKYFVLFLIWFSKFAIAQNAVLGPESLNWYFGENAALTFNTIDGKPQVLKGALVTEEGCATVSDSEGNLLFYAGGETVWNRLNRVMKGGANMPGGYSSTQAVLILQQPGVNDIYYVFNTENLGGRLTYSVVNMSLDNGLGEVVSKGIYIADSIGEKLTAVYHSNGYDIWLVVKQKNKHVFKSFLIDETGIISTPVDSEIPLGFDLSHKYSSMGYLNFSPKGDRLAAASYSASQFELYDFDRQTGEVSNPVIIKIIDDDYYPYGVCFSPDCSKLYVSYYDFDTYLIQYDLKNYDSISIAKSKKTIASFHDGLVIGAIQIGPDRKLYVSRYKNKYLSVINNPDEEGKACNFDSTGVYLLGALTRLGLPNFTYYHHYLPEEPDPTHPTIYLVIGSMQGSPGDISNKITIFAKILNDSIEAKNIDITATLEFDATAFFLSSDSRILSNNIRNDKRRITFSLSGLNLNSELKTIAKFSGTVLLARKKRNLIRFVDVNLKDTVYKVYVKNGYLEVKDVCQNRLRKISTQIGVLNIRENPLTDNLHFDFLASVSGQYSYEIISINGALLFSGKFLINNENLKVEKQIDVKNINTGLYILKIKTPVNQLSRLFIKI
jgi:hypothetical protein